MFMRSHCSLLSGCVRQIAGARPSDSPSASLITDGIQRTRISPAIFRMARAVGPIGNSILTIGNSIVPMANSIFVSKFVSWPNG